MSSYHFCNTFRVATRRAWWTCQASTCVCFHWWCTSPWLRCDRIHASIIWECFRCCICRWFCVSEYLQVHIIIFSWVVSLQWWRARIPVFSIRSFWLQIACIEWISSRRLFTLCFKNVVNLWLNALWNVLIVDHYSWCGHIHRTWSAVAGKIEQPLHSHFALFQSWARHCIVCFGLPWRSSIFIQTQLHTYMSIIIRTVVI